MFIWECASPARWDPAFSEPGSHITGTDFSHVNTTCRAGPVSRDESIAQDWDKMQDCMFANVCNKMAEGARKKKVFRWSSEMIENLITCLTAYKARMEYQAVDFDGDRPAQYKELRKEMAKLYEIEDVSLFGPLSLSAPITSIDDMTEEEKKEFLINQKKENSLIQKGHQRIQEKVKEIRQSFSKAVTAGKRSGSGKIVYEYYDELVRIWGGYPSTEPLSFGVDTASLLETPALEETPMEKADSDSQSIDVHTNLETGNSPDTPSRNMKPKAPNQVPKLIDNKRKHLEKTLSAAQRDKLLLDEAKEDLKFRKDLSEAMTSSTESFSRAMEGISSTMVQLGKSICQSVEMLSQAMVSQQQLQYQPGNHNIFYQNPNQLQPVGMTQGTLPQNDEIQAGIQQNLTNLSPQQPTYYPSSSGRQRFY